MDKHTYRVTAPDGTVLTRTTRRTYSHAVLCFGLNPRTNVEDWGIWGFVGRLELANRTAEQARKVWDTVRVVAVDNPRQ